MILFFIGYTIFFLIAMFIAIKFAPYGYEDENGFHYSNK